MVSYAEILKIIMKTWEIVKETDDFVFEKLI